LTKPQLLFDLLSIVADEYTVAGPWTQVSDTQWARATPKTPIELATMITKVGDTELRWTVLGSADVVVTDSLAKAMAEADMKLMEFGYVLVPL